VAEVSLFDRQSYCLGDSVVTSMQAKAASLVSERRTIVAIGTVVIVLGAAVLIGGLTNLAVAPAMAAARRHVADFPVPLSTLHSPLGIAVLITQNWPIWVAAQLGFAAVALAAGVAFLRQCAWARIVVEGLGWVGVALFTIPVVWIARWVLATPTDRVEGLRAGLQTLPSGVGQPVATLLLLFFGGPSEWGRSFLGWIGMVEPMTPAIQTLFAWTPTGIFVATVATLGIPAAAVGLIVLLRRRPMREAFGRSAP
jgi:hypothetical protein